MKASCEAQKAKQAWVHIIKFRWICAWCPPFVRKLKKPIDQDEEEALALPSAYKYAGGKGKRLLRSLAEGMLPKEIIRRPKHGFAPPLSDLLRGPLRTAIGDVLNQRDHVLDGWLNHDYVMTLWDQHLKGRADHRKRLYALYILKRVYAKA